MKGKEKCKALKEIRRQIAKKNDIPFAVSQCTHQGYCKGTCPKCESELRYLERELAIRQGLGKAVAIAGISIGACTAFTACSPMDTVTDFLENIGRDELAGDVMPVPDTEDDDTLAGNVELFEWEGGITEPETGENLPDTEGTMPMPPSPNPDETTPAIDGQIPLPPSPAPDETMSETEGDISIEP